MLTSAEAIESVRHGISISNLDRMIQTLGIDREVLLDILGISNRTLQRKFRANDRLSPLASDRLSRVDRIYQLAVSVFGDEKKAAEWLKRPSRALNNELPIKLLDTDAGTQQVEQELRQIEYGFVF
ncbi:MAG TPA: antitoxin Xre/MbcA/ParS toxin-binding domain-containing protein [Bryobacteraceae bacterium]|nr:antitoxin Xre/MbcA/ParS toxin-binding domain-containing protein [Bryobacteraceae bacterium]